MMTKKADDQAAESPLTLAVAALEISDPREPVVEAGIAPADPVAPAVSIGLAPAEPISLAFEADPIAVVDAVQEPAAPPPPPPPVAAAPVAQAIAPPPPRQGRFGRALPGIAAGLALFASAVSVTGVVVMSRTVGEASALVADARERKEHLEQVEKLVAELKAARAAEVAAVARIKGMRASQPASYADVQRLVDKLRNDMVRTDPQAGEFTRVREGQAELAERMAQLNIKIMRIEDAVRTSRTAKREAGREPIS